MLIAKRWALMMVGLSVLCLLGCSSTAVAVQKTSGPLRHVSDGNYKICLPDRVPSAHRFATAVTFTNTGSSPLKLQSANYPQALNASTSSAYLVGHQLTFDLYPLPFPVGAARSAWQAKQHLKAVIIAPGETDVVAIEVRHEKLSKNAHLGKMSVEYQWRGTRYVAQSSIDMTIAAERCSS